MSLYLGAHTVDNGGIDMAARRAAAAGMKALQIFTAIPKYYGDKISIKPERVERFRAALAEAKIDPKFVMAHAAYVLNTATPDEEKSTRARNGLAKELERYVQALARADVFSGTVLVAKDGKTIYAGAFGQAAGQKDVA